MAWGMTPREWAALAEREKMYLIEFYLAYQQRMQGQGQPEMGGQAPSTQGQGFSMPLSQLR